jgi:hypothetical protein
MKTALIFTTGLAVGVVGTCVSVYFYSKSNQNKLATVMSEIPQDIAFTLAEAMPEKLASKAPIVMAALWKNAAIGSSAKKLYPELAEKFDASVEMVPISVPMVEGVAVNVKSTVVLLAEEAEVVATGAKVVAAGAKAVAVAVAKEAAEEEVVSEEAEAEVDAQDIK